MAAAPQKKEATAESAAAPAPNKKKLIVMILAVVLLVGLSVGGTIVGMKMMGGGKEENHATEEAEEETEEAEKVVMPANYFDMKPNFTVNFNVDGRPRFLQAAVTLMYRDPELLRLLELHMPAMRNGLVMLLGAKKFEDLQTMEGRETLRQETLKIFQDLIKKEKEILAKNSEDEEKKKATESNIEQVLFTNFVMQ
jgi:flagellar protein FliL